MYDLLLNSILSIACAVVSIDHSIHRALLSPVAAYPVKEHQSRRGRSTAKSLSRHVCHHHLIPAPAWGTSHSGAVHCATSVQYVRGESPQRSSRPVRIPSRYQSRSLSARCISCNAILPHPPLVDPAPIR